MILRGSELTTALHGAADKHICAIMSYLSKGKWYVAKVRLQSLQGSSLYVEADRPKEKQQPVNVQVEQPVGLSYKYEYGKFVFDSVVTALKPSANSQAGGLITLAVPGKVEVVQRRSYFRVNVPESLKVNVVMWHRKSMQGLSVESPTLHPPSREGHGRPGGLPIFGDGAQAHGKSVCPTDYSNARLTDISAGGAQIMIDSASCEHRADFRKGQFIGMRFTPLPYETPLLLNAQIRTTLPNADGAGMYLGLQLVGLEASPEGQEVLARLVEVIEQYHKMNQANTQSREAKHSDLSAKSQAPA
jgi:hypothetical protein